MTSLGDVPCSGSCSYNVSVGVSKTFSMKDFTDTEMHNISFADGSVQVSYSLSTGSTNISITIDYSQR
jgi:prepilin-type processing-associated H-X9-DG protein